MQPAQRQSELRRRGRVVRVVVHHVVGEVACDEAGQTGIAQRRAEQQRGDEPRDDHDRSGEQDRHDQAQRVARMIMVDAMDQEMEALAERAGELPVEEVAVAEILDQRPDEVAEREHAHNGQRRHQLEPGGEQGDDHRQVDEQRHRPVNAGELVEQRVVEQARRCREPVRLAREMTIRCRHPPRLPLMM